MSATRYQWILDTIAKHERLQRQGKAVMSEDELNELRAERDSIENEMTGEGDATEEDQTATETIECDEDRGICTIEGDDYGARL